MKLETALEKGYLNVTDEDAGLLLETVYNLEHPQQRLEAGLLLFSTFVPEEKLGMVLDLASIVIEAYDEMEIGADAHDHADGCDCGHDHH